MMRGIRRSIVGVLVPCALAALGITGCSRDPCSIHHVVTASDSGMKVDQVELDDGFVYVPLAEEAPYAHFYTTGTEVKVCEVTSQVDGSRHFSIVTNEIKGVAPTEMRRLDYQGQ
jgi:hypothetical protein